MWGGEYMCGMGVGSTLAIGGYMVLVYMHCALYNKGHLAGGPQG